MRENFNDFSDDRKADLQAAYQKWLEMASEHIQGQVVLLTPVDLGALKDSIDKQVDTGELRAYVGTNKEYAIYVEKGTGEFAVNGDGRVGGWVYKSPKDNEFYFTYGQKPQPYLVPGFENSKGAIITLAKEVLSQL